MDWNKDENDFTVGAHFTLVVVLTPPIKLTKICGSVSFSPCALVAAIPTMRLNDRVVYNTWPARDSTPIFRFSTVWSQLSNGGNLTVRSGSAELHSKTRAVAMETNWRWRPLAVAAVPFLFSFDTTPFSSTSRRDQGVYVDLLPVRRTHRIFGGNSS